jgi:hypothetical protein
MGSVGNVDIVLNTINSYRNTLKWYKKYCCRLVDISLYNYYILYSHVTVKKFNLMILTIFNRTILQKYFEDKKQLLRGRKDANNPPFCLTERYFPSKSVNEQEKTIRKRCVACS